MSTRPTKPPTQATQDTQPAYAPRTADRGAGAPALHTARDAVRQDAVRFGSSDPASPWGERGMALKPRNRTEHLAIGSGEQNEMFTFTPGTRVVDPKSPEAAPFTEFLDTWRKRRDVDAQERDYFARWFARTHKIATSKADEDGRVGTSATVAGLVFEAVGSDLYDSLDALAYTVRAGPARAVRKAIPEPSARGLLAHARARLPEAERAA